MKGYKKLACCMLAAAMVTATGAALVGCGGEDDGDTAEIKTVKVWLHKSESEVEGQLYKSIQNNFNDEEFKTSSGRTIRMRIEFYTNADSLATAIRTEKTGGTLPDVVAVDSPDIARYADQKILTDISSYIEEETLADYVDSVVEQGTINGGLYALSGMDSPTGLYYNRELLKSVGYTDDQFGTIENPWTWDDVKEAMTKLKEADKKYQIKLNLGFGGKEGGMYLYSPLVYSAGGSFMNEQGKPSGAFDSDQTVAGLQQIEWLFNEGEKWYYEGQNADAFLQEQTAFEVYGTWNIATANQKYTSFVSKYGVMPMPVYKDAQGNKGTVSAGCGSWGFGVTPDAKDKEAAAKVVEYLTSAQSSELLYDSIGTFPTHKSSFENDDFKSGPVKMFADILTNCATPRPVTVNYTKYRDAFQTLIEYMQTSYGSKDYNLKTKATGLCATIN